MARCRLLRLASGETTPFDGEWLLEYDPKRESVDKNGEIMNCHLVTTPDPAKALDVPMPVLLELICRSDGIRADGEPNRPICGFSIEISA